MTFWGRLVFAGCVFVASLAGARADDDVAHTVLSPEDVSLYREIFRAESAGQSAKADAASAKLADASLVGYALEDRYMGPHHRSLYSELRAWLDRYGDLVGADRVYRLAVKRAPKGARVPRPVPVRWRGARGEGDAFAGMELETVRARQTMARMRALERDGKPEAAHALLENLSSDKRIPQDDIDRLAAYVAAAYLAEAKNESALALAEEMALRQSVAAAQFHWTAGLAAYRLGQDEKAASHFEAVSQSHDSASRTLSAGAFWAARSWMRAGVPEKVLPLYQRAASEPDNFYGYLAEHMIGRSGRDAFTEPVLDSVSFARLMRNKAAHRAVALWQIGRQSEMEEELARAFGEIEPELDSAFAALAHHLGAASLELRAAELASTVNRRLSSLYPVPSYEPVGGYVVDKALVLAVARQESRFDPDAVSRSGARGVMQIMPATAARVTGDRTLIGANRKRLDDPRYNLSLGQSYMRDLLDRQGGNLIVLAAAYNAGAGNLSRWMALHQDVDDPLLFIESIPAPETRDYVKRVMMNMWMYRKRFGETASSLDQAAAGFWPVYKPSGTVAAN